jgi:hypothetical protein
MFFLCTSDERVVYQMSMDGLLAMLNILKNVIISFLDELPSMFNRLILLTRHMDWNRKQDKPIRWLVKSIANKCESMIMNLTHMYSWPNSNPPVLTTF